MNQGMALEVFFKGVRDDSYGEGADRKTRHLADVYAPGHGDFSIQVGPEEYGKFLNIPPMITRFRLPFTLQNRSEVRRSSRTGKDYATGVVVVRWGNLELIEEPKAAKAS